MDWRRGGDAAGRVDPKRRQRIDIPHPLRKADMATDSRELEVMAAIDSTGKPNACGALAGKRRVGQKRDGV